MSAPEVNDDSLPAETGSADAGAAVANAADAVVKAAPKSKLGLILGLFVLAAIGILGTRYVLDSQIPEADTSFQKEAAPQSDGMSRSGGGGGGGMGIKSKKSTEGEKSTEDEQDPSGI